MRSDSVVAGVGNSSLKLTRRQLARLLKAHRQGLDGFVVLRLSARNRYVRRLDDAEQVALIALARAAQRYRPEKRGAGGFKGFAYRVIAHAVLNAAMRHFGRDGKKSGQCPVDELDPPGREPEPLWAMVKAEERDAVARVIGKVENALAPVKVDARGGGDNPHNRLLKLIKQLDPEAKVGSLKTGDLLARAGEVIRARLVAS
jgi:DNA-directed RNA polymerase specialized sigma24 family protein